MALNLIEFKKDLLAVLEKHKVTLGVDINGDTHGIQIEGFIAMENNTDIEHILCDYSAYLSAIDLKES